MIDPHATSRAAAADPKGSGGGSLGGARRGDRAEGEGTPPPSGPERTGLESDPIFQAPKPTEPTAKGTLLLWQFFLFPLLVVAAAVGVFVFFGAIGGSQRTPPELLKDLRQGGENEQKQAAQQLARLIGQERTRLDREGEKAAPPFYADPVFRAGIRDAFKQSLEDKGASDERRQWLAIALGRMAPPAPSAEGRETADLLLGVLYPPPGKAAPSGKVRLAAATGLKDMESADAEGALLRAAQDPDDAEVRVMGTNGLALLALPSRGVEPSPAVTEALRRALGDAHAGVRVNAAYALGLRGDEAALPVLEMSLDRESLASMGIRDVDWQRNALLNAIGAAQALSAPSLKPLVERLADSKAESDELVRAKAAEALRRWRNP